LLYRSRHCWGWWPTHGEKEDNASDEVTRERSPVEAAATAPPGTQVSPESGETHTAHAILRKDNHKIKTLWGGM
jgi:hypothetical protein